MNSSYAADETAAVCFGSVYMVITVCVHTPIVKILQMLCNIPLRWRSFEELHSVGSCCSSLTEYIYYETSLLLSTIVPFSNPAHNNMQGIKKMSNRWSVSCWCNGKV
mmetsp:Transcript_20562/g.30973  ORF Transcript_20562/g.30973 Transcript_20562/m.30973 type:complete len:107 (-) Transcript_20562:127-447(-)